ncbi:MAG: RnfABCDGE type electron transport complex subunit D [Leptospiraceae bacterium]|nr:RnfABCDGE type electron transport complex subunit D [Leptospiraceae bacterium]
MNFRIQQFFLMFTLLILGINFREFSIHILQIFLTILSVNLTQAFWLSRLGLKEVGFQNSLITSMGLSLLLRSEHFWVHPLIGFLVISAKFLVRVRGKHLFNPAMLGVALGIYLFPNTWCSSGQWGHGLAITLALYLFGFWVSLRAQMEIMSFSFLGFYLILLAFRVLHYGYSLQVFTHWLQSGSLVLFSFFMITDPKTCPNNFFAKILHSFLVALLGYYLAFRCFIPNSLILSLFLLSVLVPIWDILLPTSRHHQL